MAEYYEWLTPQHSDIGMKKQRTFVGCFGLKLFNVMEYKMPYLINWMNEYSSTKPLTAIDILPIKIYTEIKNGTGVKYES